MKPRTQTTRSGEERALFLRALEIAPLERSAFLESTCSGNRDLRQRVDELLREQEELNGFMETPALRPIRETPDALEESARLAQVTEKPGDSIGRFKLVQKIGEGGCGVVYLAEQQEPVRRCVALKIIKLGMDTGSVIARFQAERQALAMMDHPNIAKVLDAGATETGRPFFVMELVRGVRITDYCDQHNLMPEDRLDLFIQVCQAIQHAHQKGIIHRDIKPSNILVTLHDGRPVPKVIDFGIAKATEQRLTELTLTTEFHAFLGTPAYMSPEQAEVSGLDIDTRSDIYSLGVLLYELLVGKPPFDPETLILAGLDGCRKTILEVEPVRPSTRLSSLAGSELVTTAGHRRTEAARLVSLVRGDLDWIVMKCLEKDRTRRYETASALALDVHNYLDDEPILARPPSNWYRVKKMFRRHRGAFAAAAAVALALIVGATVSAWQAVRATRAENRAHAGQLVESQLRHQAELEKASARLNEYVSDINLAQQSLAAGNYGRAVQLLAKHRPHANEPDLRGFEWSYLWKLSRGDPHIELPRQERHIEAVALSPSGDLVAVGGREEFSVWDRRTKKTVMTAPKGGFSLAFFPDGNHLVSASFTTVRIWNTSDWKNDQSLPGNSAPVAIAANGTRLVTTSRDGVRVWDTATWKELYLLRGSFGGPVAISPDGQTVATDTPAGVIVRSVDGSRPEVLLEDSAKLFSRPGPGGRREGPLAFSPDGKEIVAPQNTLTAEGVFVLTIWNTESGKKVAVMPEDTEHIEHVGVITSLAFASDGHTLATASLDHSVRLWDFPARQRISVLQGHLSEVWAVGLSADGQTVVSAAKDREVKLWPAHPQRREEILTGVRHPLLFSQDGQRLAGLTRDSSVVFLNLTTSEIEQQIQFERSRGRSPFVWSSVGLSSDLRTMARGADDGTVTLWDTVTHQTNILKVADGPAELVALSPDGKVLITHGRNWTMRRWDIPSGTSTVWRTSAFKAIFSPDGGTLATLGRGNVIQLWDSSTLAPLGKLLSDVEPAFGIAAFSPDGSKIAVVCEDDIIRLWDVDSRRFLGSCIGHKQGVRSVAFSADGKTLATASDDSTLKLWNVATQQELLSIRQLGATLTGLMFSPDGRLLVGGSGAFSPTGGLRFFSATPISEL